MTDSCGSLETNMACILVKRTMKLGLLEHNLLSLSHSSSVPRDKKRAYCHSRCEMETGLGYSGGSYQKNRPHQRWRQSSLEDCMTRLHVTTIQGRHGLMPAYFLTLIQVFFSEVCRYQQEVLNVAPNDEEALLLLDDAPAHPVVEKLVSNDDKLRTIFIYPIHPLWHIPYTKDS